MHQDIWISVLFHASHMPKVGQTACLAVVLHWYPFPSGVPSIYPHSVFCLFVIFHYLSQDSHLKCFQLSFLIFFYSSGLELYRTIDWSIDWYRPWRTFVALLISFAFQMLLTMSAARPILLSTSLSQKPSALTTPPRHWNSSHEHIAAKVKAHSMFGIIKRNFLWVDIKTFCLLYKTMVRSQLEYAAVSGCLS